MFIVSVAYVLVLVSDATVVLDVNTTVGESTVLPCILSIPTTAGLKNLRFYWQDERQDVLYSFNAGKEMPEHVNELYQGRVTAFPLDMIRGNISVKLKNATLGENQRVFKAYAAVFESKGMRRYILEHTQICRITLHVTVPYESVSLDVNEEMTRAVCTAQRGFPKPLVKWTLQNPSDNNQHFIDPRAVHTTAVQDPQDHLYSLRSTIVIPGGPYRSVTCLIHNPTLNVTRMATHALNKGEAARGLPGWTGALMVTAVVLSLS